MTSAELRRSFLDFFREKEHTIVPSSSLLPDAPNLLFTNAGMNQFVPIFLGQAPCPYRPARAADTQKCIRAGGKHNDLEDVGFDTYHHTFFEMLGNWSFGDYFKQEAIAWAWELVVGRWRFPASRLYATVYCPHMNMSMWRNELDFAIRQVGNYRGASGPDKTPRPTAKKQGSIDWSDQEATCFWAKIFLDAGLDPAIHIVPGNKKDNFWMMGDTGPCGPCSELHVDLTPGARELDEARQRAGREFVNKGDARCIEIWNLVFIQFNANPDGSFADLPARHVDTGLGFERVCSIVQGTNGLTDFSEEAKISNYETDIFRPLFDELEKLTGKKYASTLPASAQNLSEQEKVDVAFRVIADHLRTLSFAIADGIRPSNEGRGYVLRRILRRAVRYGRNLGLREPFLAKLVPVLGAKMGDIFPEIIAQAELIQTTLRKEEESFFRTLERGIELFEGFISFGQTRDAMFAKKFPKFVAENYKFGAKFPGSIAFELYDTYGFPLDLTELMARERGFEVDTFQFNRSMDEQKARAKAAQKKGRITVHNDERSTDDELKYGGQFELKTQLIHSERESAILASVVPEQTQFYVAMGGQVGDIGQLRLDDQIVAITEVEKINGAIHHVLAPPLESKEVLPFVTLILDVPRRARIEGHHSVTHILHWALREVLGPTIGQKGSYVGPDRLRFDFSHGAALTPAQIAEVEALVNERIAEDAKVDTVTEEYVKVKGDPSILQFFGDKYGETVRVVSIGDFSRELCGGTHVRHTAQIGYFKILSEGAIAAGIRRIEAASGVALEEILRERIGKQDEQFAALRVRQGSLAPLPVVADGARAEILAGMVEKREEALRAAQAEVAAREKEQAKAAEADFQRRAAAQAVELIAGAETLGDIPFVAHVVTDLPAAYLPSLADALKTRWQGVAVLAATAPDKVALLCSVAPAFTKRVQAGKIIQAIASLVGGKGGGRPELAQGGGANPDGVSAALTKAEEVVRAAGQ